MYIYNRWPNYILDHIDGNRANNKLSNLREATQSQNCANAKLRSNNTSGFKGVYYHPKTGKWKSQIKKDGVSRHLGLFPTPEEAHKAYVKAAKELFGEFARGS